MAPVVSPMTVKAANFSKSSVRPRGVDAEGQIAVIDARGVGTTGVVAVEAGAVAVVVGPTDLREGTHPLAVLDLHDQTAVRGQVRRRVGLGVQATTGPARDLLAGGEDALALEDVAVRVGAVVGRLGEQQERRRG